MPIVSSEITGVINKPGGRRKLSMQAVDDTGRVWQRRVNVHGGNDDSATLAVFVSEFDTFSKKQEREQIEQFITNGGDPATIVAVYIPPNQVDKAIIRAVMRAVDPLSVMLGAKHIQDNITNPQMNNWYGDERRIRIRTRTNDMIANESLFQSDRDLIEEIDDED